MIITIIIIFILIIIITITINTFTHINILQMVKFTIIALTWAEVYSQNHRGIYFPSLRARRGGETFSTCRETFWIFVDFKLIFTHLCRNFFVPTYFFCIFHYFFPISSYISLKASISIGEQKNFPRMCTCSRI